MSNFASAAPNTHQYNATSSQIRSERPTSVEYGLCALAHDVPGSIKRNQADIVHDVCRVVEVTKSLSIDIVEIMPKNNVSRHPDSDQHCRKPLDEDFPVEDGGSV